MYIYSGLVISGRGKIVEVFIPSTGQHCKLANLPKDMSFHSMEKMVVCGGRGPGNMFVKSCHTLTDAGWRKTHTLLEHR